jgi:hypothetical protein
VNSLHVVDTVKNEGAKEAQGYIALKTYDCCYKYKVYVLSGIIKSESICFKVHVLLSLLDSDISKFQIILEES